MEFHEFKVAVGSQTIVTIASDTALKTDTELGKGLAAERVGQALLRMAPQFAPELESDTLYQNLRNLDYEQAYEDGFRAGHYAGKRSILRRLAELSAGALADIDEEEGERNAKREPSNTTEDK